MHVTLTVKHARRDPALEELFERERGRIERRLHGVPLDLVSLHAEVEANVHLKEGYATLRLSLPSGVLSARGVGANVLAALRDATLELMRELQRHRKRAARGQGRLAFRANVLRRGFDAFDDLFEPAEEDLAAQIRRVLPQVEAFVHREWERHRVVRDGALRGSVDLADVVEEAVLEALARRAERPADVPFDRWVFSCAYDVLLREEERVQRGVQVMPMVDDPATPFDLVDGAEESARAGARTPDTGIQGGRSAEAEAEGRTLLATLLRAVRRLPGEPREALSLVALAGMAERDAARRLRCSEAQVRERLTRARSTLAQEMLARGYEVGPALGGAARNGN